MGKVLIVVDMSSLLVMEILMHLHAVKQRQCGKQQYVYEVDAPDMESDEVCTWYMGTRTITYHGDTYTFTAE